MIRINEILDKVSVYIENPDLALIQKAYLFSASAHEGQTRLSGEPYLSHPMQVASVLADMQLDEATVVAGLLHDTVEDTDTTVDDIEDLFGEEVADIVDGVTKISKMEFTSKAEAQAENIRKMILAMAEDIRVLMVKLADRLHNMRTLDFQKPYKQMLIAQETLDIYSPLANRLGLHRVKTELEDMCLKYLKPDVYAMIEDGVQGFYATGTQYIETVLKYLQGMLQENEIDGHVFGRTKHRYSTHMKMIQQKIGLEEVCDLVAFRIIVTSIKDCYSVLGLVHAEWKPVAGRFKDYISIPKANMYQSLHTTVIGIDGQRVEIQIRTEEMNQVAEYGVAAHWQYKEKGKKANTRDAERFTWLRQILDWQRELNDPREFMASLRIDLFQEEVYIFTPQGDIKELPEGATSVDFAYAIHSEVGDRCAGAKVNGRLVPLETALKNGDSVEIITSNSHKPSRDWLKFVKTAKARTRIKHFIHNEERSRSIALGKELLEKEGRKHSINFQKAMKDGKVIKLAEGFSVRSEEDLLSQVGFARISPRRVIKRLYSVIHGDKPIARPQPKEGQGSQEKEKKPKAETIRISGVDNMLVRFASCCNPIPGEAIVGYITRGRGATIHRVGCAHLDKFESERLIQVSWGDEDNKPHPANIRIKVKNITGMLERIASVFTAQEVNIDSGSFQSNVDGFSLLELTVEVRDLSQLHSALSKVKNIKGVKEAIRTS
ncbi:MAG: RelA/SpoT family protein [Desulfovibrio sp.]